jgi:hypothetical protein
VLLQILSVPGYPEANSKVRMMAMKRYSDFKALRAALIEVIAAKQRAEVSAATAATVGEVEGAGEGAERDILKVARSRRSSVEREIAISARDSLACPGFVRWVTA